MFYHPGNASVVAVTLSRLSMGSASHVHEQMKELAKEVQRLIIFEVRLMSILNSVVTVKNGTKSLLGMKVKEN